MIELERKAFDLWLTDASDAFKRAVLIQLYDMILERPNSTNKNLVSRLQSVNANINEEVFNDAIASLKSFGVVATVPAPHCEDQYHVNIKSRKKRLWQSYKFHRTV